MPLRSHAKPKNGPRELDIVQKGTPKAASGRRGGIGSARSLTV